MVTLPSVPMAKKMSAEELNSYLYKLVEALTANILNLEKRIKELEENNG